MNNSKRLLTIVQTALRQANRKVSSDVTEVSPSLKKLKENQKRFQIDDGVPVYKKAGPPDRILLGLTTALVLVTLGMSAQTLWELTFPKKN